MPNHIHGIIAIVDTIWAKDVSPLPGKQMMGTSKTIGSIVRGLKIGVTKWARQNKNINNVWQRNYYEHIIRDDNDLDRIREYIINNPVKWPEDRYYEAYLVGINN